MRGYNRDIFFGNERIILIAKISTLLSSQNLYLLIKVILTKNEGAKAN
jgi:hypothetical protein